MIKKFFLQVSIVIFFVMGSLSFSDSSNDSLLLSYQRNFIRANIYTKIDILNDAKKVNSVDMTPLYKEALRFTEASYALLESDPSLAEIGSIAILKLGELGDKSGLPSIQRLFETIKNDSLQIACLRSFSLLAKNDIEQISFLNNWYQKNISALVVGQVSTSVIIECINTLGTLGEASSFSVLFETLKQPIDDEIALAIKKTLSTNFSSYTDRIIAIITKGDLDTIYIAWSVVKENELLTLYDKGRITEMVATSALKNIKKEPKLAKKLGHESLAVLKALKWTGASSVVVKYFYAIQLDYKIGNATVEDLIPVIQCMGAMGSKECTQALSIFLGLLNSEMEKKKTYDEQLLLNVITALGDLGDKNAFDYLLYVDYLDYPSSVKKSSRDAIAKLQW